MNLKKYLEEHVKKRFSFFTFTMFKWYMYECTFVLHYFCGKWSYILNDSVVLSQFYHSYYIKKSRKIYNYMLQLNLMADNSTI